jgi:hypothetical protein
MEKPVGRLTWPNVPASGMAVMILNVSPLVGVNPPNSETFNTPPSITGPATLI